jgi:hypothetical protein
MNMTTTTDTMTAELRDRAGHATRKRTREYDDTLALLAGPASPTGSDRRDALDRLLAAGAVLGKTVAHVEAELTARTRTPSKPMAHVVVLLPPGPRSSTTWPTVPVGRASTGSNSLNFPKASRVYDWARHPDQTPEEFAAAIRCQRAYDDLEPDGFNVRVAELAAAGFKHVRPGMKIQAGDPGPQCEAIAGRVGLYRILKAIAEATVLRRIEASPAADYVYREAARRLGVVTSEERDEADAATVASIRAGGGVINPTPRSAV